MKRSRWAAVGAALLGVWAFTRPVRPPPPGLADSQSVLSGLLPEVATRARQLLQEAWRQGIALVLTSGYRSLSEQAVLYAQGRTTAGPIVTDAEPGESWHNYRRAFDVAFLTPEGRRLWPPAASPLWETVGRLGRALDLDWGRDFGDDPHFDYHPGLTLTQAQRQTEV